MEESSKLICSLYNIHSFQYTIPYHICINQNSLSASLGIWASRFWICPLEVQLVS